MGTIQLLDLEKSVLSLLNESLDSTIADLRAGAAGGATIASIITAGSGAATIKTFLNEGAAELARTCYPVPDTGTLSWTSGTRSNLINAFTPGTTGNILWSVRGVKFGTSPTTGLRYCERAAVERNDPDFMVTANGTPVYWYRDGEMSIGIYPKPTSTGTATIDGYAVPVPLSAYNDTMAWIPDDLTHLLVYYACVRVAQQNYVDDTVAGRAAIWQAEYDKGRMDLWNKIDPRIRKAHFPTAPTGGK